MMIKYYWVVLLAILLVLPTSYGQTVASKDFFTELISNKADLTTGESVFKFCNPYDYQFILDDKNLKIMYDNYRGKTISSFEISILEDKITSEKDLGNPTVSCKPYIMGNGSNVQNCTSTYKNIDVTTTTATPLKSKSLLKGECVLIKVIGHYKAKLGYSSKDWYPVLTTTSETLTYKAWAWWSTNFTTKIEFNITCTNTTVSVVDEYLANLTLDTKTLIDSGLIDSNCKGIRFVDSSETNLYNHEVENCNNRSTVFWLQITNLQCLNKVTQIFAYLNTTGDLPTFSGNPFGNYTIVYHVNQSVRNNGTVFDSSPSGWNGTAINTTLYDAYETGKFGGGFNCSGELYKSIIKLTKAIPSGTQNLVMDFWFKGRWKAGYLDQSQPIQTFWNSNDANININYNANILGGFYGRLDGGTTTDNKMFYKNLTTNQWYHLVLKANRTTWDYYLDGIFINRTTRAGWSILSGMVSQGICGQPDMTTNRMANGTIDEFRIRNNNTWLENVTNTLFVQDTQISIVNFTRQTYVTPCTAKMNITGCDELICDNTNYTMTGSISGSTEAICLNIQSFNNTIDCNGYTIDGTDKDDSIGITINQNSNKTVNTLIKNCIINDFETDIFVDNSNYISLKNITGSSSTNCIKFFDSKHILSENLNCSTAIFNGSEVYAITLFDSGSHGLKSYNYSFFNTSLYAGDVNNQEGISIDAGVKYVLFDNFYISNYKYGMNYIGYADALNYFTFRNGTITGSSDYCIYTVGMETGLYENITLEWCETGIYLGFENNVTLNNSIIKHNLVGIKTECSHTIEYEGYTWIRDKIYNNFLNNTVNFEYGTNDGECFYGNDWNRTSILGNRIYTNGTYIGGNFWANLTGDGYSQICSDSNSDCFCDCPYDVQNNRSCNPLTLGVCGEGCSDNTDYLPLTYCGQNPEDCIEDWYFWNSSIECYNDSYSIESWWWYDLNQCNESYLYMQNYTYFFNESCTEPEINITYGNMSGGDCCPIFTLFCADNTTLVQEWNINNITTQAYVVCQYGCNAELGECNPNIFYQMLIFLGINVLFIILFVIDSKFNSVLSFFVSIGFAFLSIYIIEAFPFYIELLSGFLIVYPFAFILLGMAKLFGLIK